MSSLQKIKEEVAMRNSAPGNLDTALGR